MQTSQTEQEMESVALSLYETDFYAWTQEQAEFLRDGKWSQLDLVNLIEEIESFGKQQRYELRNRLSILIEHLLKWEYQSNRRSRIVTIYGYLVLCILSFGNLTLNIN